MLITGSFVSDSFNLLISSVLKEEHEVIGFDLVLVIPARDGEVERLDSVMHSYLFAHKQAYPASVLLISSSGHDFSGEFLGWAGKKYSKTRFQCAGLMARPSTTAELAKALKSLGLIKPAVPKPERTVLTYNLPGP